jgi:hypothetical protein
MISRRNLPTSSAVQPEGFPQSRQLLNKPPEPVKRLFQKKEKLIWAKYLEALSSLFAFLGGRLLTKQNSRVNRPFHFCFLGDRGHVRAQKMTEARRLGAP